MNIWEWDRLPAEAEDLLCSEQQRTVFRLLRKGLSQPEAASYLGVSTNAVKHMIARMKTRLMRAGCDPEHDYQMTAPPPYDLVNKTVHRRRNKETGQLEVEQIWDKPKLDQQHIVEAYKDSLAAICQEGVKPFKPNKRKPRSDADYVSDYTLTDFHLGMYAWLEETGNDWDMRIAETVWLNAIADMMDAAKPSKTAIFTQLGDFMHWDGIFAVTPMSKHVLDADTRFHKLARTAAGICVKAVEMLLRKHQKVHVICAEGNHDMASSIWLTCILDMMFQNEPRVTVDKSAFPYYMYRFHNVFLGKHHGHLKKMAQLVTLFSTEPRFKKDFGECEHCYIHTGHLHYEKVVREDIGGIIVEQHPTLAARDAYAARGFLFSQRGAKSHQLSQGRRRIE